MKARPLSRSTVERIAWIMGDDSAASKALKVAGDEDRFYQIGDRVVVQHWTTRTTGGEHHMSHHIEQPSVTGTYRFVVLPESRESRRHGISWGPFTLEEARAFVHRHDGGFIVFPEDERHENPRIWNYVDPDSRSTGGAS